MTIPFAKYEGCGNDFICMDHRRPFLPPSFYEKIPDFCDRTHGIGADGVILLENSSVGDYRMRIYNADGSEAEMCGNGIRCLTKFIYSLGDHRPSFKIETMERCLSVEHVGDQVKVEMGAPCDQRWSIPLEIEDSQYTVHHINTGVPHVVLFDASNKLDFEKIAPALRYHQHFSPKGANANLAYIEGNVIFIRTFERGVEGETLACGTGAAAVAVAAAHLYRLEAPITICTRSKECLKVGINQKENGIIENLTLSGPANFVVAGDLSELFTL